MKSSALTRKLVVSIFTCALALTAVAAAPSPFHEPLRWKSTGPLIQPVSDENHHLVSIKDPTIVQFGGKWHIYATVANTARQWSMVYLNFTDWSEAGSAKPVYLDVANPGLRGYHCAPQLFYFRPQRSSLPPNPRARRNFGSITGSSATTGTPTYSRRVTMDVGTAARRSWRISRTASTRRWW